MSDSVVVKKGFGTRMKNGFSGILGGIILVLIGIGVLIWNERSNVVNIHDVKEMRDVYKDVSSEKVDKENNDNLIVTSGKLDFGDETLTDETFKVSIKTPTLVRVVEMYQWKEEVEEDEDKTTYNYTKVWSKELIDSSKFNQSGSHTNPTTMPYEEFSAHAKELKVGAYKLSSSFAGLVTTNKTYSNLEGATIPEGYKLNGNYITKTADEEKDSIGDVRISFQYADYSDVTVMGKQHEDTIIEYTTKEKSRITYFVEGTHDGDYIITQIEKGNKMFKWLLRLIGTIMIISGIKSLFGPLTALSSYVPILRNIVNGATGLISFFVGLAISLVVIAISWLVFRPILGISLLVGAVILIILAKKLGSKKPETNPTPTEQSVEEKQE